jgi:hypothetical protein
LNRPFRTLLLAVAVAGSAGCDTERHVPVPYPKISPPEGRLENSASFLMDDLKIRNMNILSLQIDRARFESHVDACIANGDDTIAFFVTNKGDGKPPITSFYENDAYGSAVDHDKVDEMLARIRLARDRDLRVHLWVWADDSRFQEFSDDTHREHLSRCVEMFDELADAWCVGLELDEWLDKGRIRRLTRDLKDITEKPVGVHFTRLKKWSWTIDAGADLLFGQYGFGKTAEEIGRMTEDVVRKLDGRAHYWAWEYHKSAETDEAKTLGDAAIAVSGCIGTGCGRHR